jgi:hypothetical protein
MMRLLLDPRKEHPLRRFHSGKTRDRRHAYLQQMATRNAYEFPGEVEPRNATNSGAVVYVHVRHVGCTEGIARSRRPKSSLGA